MALLPTTLITELQRIAASPPDTHPACARAWADAVRSYAVGITPPSTTVSAASEVLATSLVTPFSSDNGASGMASAFTAFAAAVGGGMAGFVAVPPPSPPNFAGLFAEPHPATHLEGAQKISQLIDTWLRTGTAAPVAGGPAVPWS